MKVVVLFFMVMFGLIGAGIAHARGSSVLRGFLKGMTGFGALLMLAYEREETASAARARAKSSTEPPPQN